MKMTKRWNYHHISDEYLNKSLKEIREEYNIELLPLDQIPIGRYQSSQEIGHLSALYDVRGYLYFDESLRD